MRTIGANATEVSCSIGSQKPAIRSMNRFKNALVPARKGGGGTDKTKEVRRRSRLDSLCDGEG